MSCTAPPGWYCPPLTTTPIVCPENWYCPGGAVMARKCPDGRWSAINSIYPEDCLAHMTVNYTVILILLFVFFALLTCVWAASWEWDDRKDKFKVEVRPYASKYGSVTFHGKPYDVYEVHDVRAQPGV